MLGPFDLIFHTSLDRLQLQEWVNNTHLPVILAMVEVFRE